MIRLGLDSKVSKTMQSYCLRCEDIKPEDLPMIWRPCCIALLYSIMGRASIDVCRECGYVELFYTSKPVT